MTTGTRSRGSGAPCAPRRGEACDPARLPVSARRRYPLYVTRKRSPARLVIALSIAAVLAVFLLYTSIAGGGTPSLKPSQLTTQSGKVSLVGKVVGKPTGDSHAGGLRLKSATETVASLKDSRRLNPRALGTTDIEPVLASGLRTLESCLLAIRSLFTVLLTELPTEDRPDDPYGEELRAAFAVVLHDAADCIRAFGSLVLAEVEEHEEEAERSLDESLDILRETQTVLTELMMVDTQENKSSWLLRGSILAAVAHVVDELNLEEHARARQQWKDAQRTKPLAHLPPIVHAALPHPDRPLLRGLPPGSTWRNAFTRQIDEQDHHDDQERTDD